MSGTAPDGSPVELYAMLAPLGEPELVDAAIPSASLILELGCGAGRITHALVALGHRVTAVDNSPEMLARVRGAETVLANIEGLALERRFPVVLLASNFLNIPDVGELSAILETCSRHVDRGGQVLLERMPPDWEPRPGATERGGVRMTVRNPMRDADLISAVMEYEAAGARWTHPFEARLRSDAELDAVLQAAGLERTRWLDDGRSWLEARLAA